MKVGDVFDRLTVIERAPNVGKHAAWTCLCICGKTKIVTAGNLRAGRVRSCNCLRTEVQAEKHARLALERVEHCDHPLYGTWKSIKGRCYTKSTKSYPNYGGRGITMAKEWKNDFPAFRDWMMTNLGERPAGMSLDRIDNGDSYIPGNLRWATQSEQHENRRPQVTNAEVEYLLGQLAALGWIDPR